MTLTRAITDCRTRMHKGMAAPLAIYKTSQEYGCTTRDLALAIRGQRHKAKHVPVTTGEEWWNR